MAFEQRHKTDVQDGHVNFRGKAWENILGQGNGATKSLRQGHGLFVQRKRSEWLEYTEKRE